MYVFTRSRGAASALAIATFGSAAVAQVSTPATPHVGSPPLSERPAPLPRTSTPSPGLVPRGDPLPASLTLEQALEEAEARSPAIIAARASIEAAEARLRQAGYRTNPELSVEVENFAGTGEYQGFSGTDTTISLSQRLDLYGRRSSRVAGARAAITAEQLRLALARADLAQSVRDTFATAIATRDRLRLASENTDRARELARIAGTLVEVGREPPLRGLRARAALAQSEADLQVARADEEVSRRSLAALFGIETPPNEVVGSLSLPRPPSIPATETIEVRIAEAELLAANADVRQEIAAGRLDPAVGIGIRRLQGTRDQALVAGLTVPLRIFDQNRGNVASSRALVRAAEARRDGAIAIASARIRNAAIGLDAAQARVAALEGSAIPQAAEALRLAQLSYQTGRLPLVELLDTQQAFTATRTQAIDARLAEAQAATLLARLAAR